MRIEDPARRKFVEQRRNEEEKELLTGKKEASAEKPADAEKPAETAEKTLSPSVVKDIPLPKIQQEAFSKSKEMPESEPVEVVKKASSQIGSKRVESSQPATAALKAMGSKTSAASVPDSGPEKEKI